MSFKNLEERFAKNTNTLYAGAKNKFANGQASNARTDDPLIVREPNKGYVNSIEGRGAPIRSTAEDVKRITLFSTSPRGLVFLAKQQLLQTGNTFEHTRIINPAFVVANAVPFLHVKRNLRPLSIGGAVGRILSFVGIKTGDGNTSIKELRKIGQLQQETYNKYVAGGGGKISALLKKIPVIGQTISAVTAKRSMGEVGNGWTYSRPELGKNNSGYIMYAKLTDENAKRRGNSFSNVVTRVATQIVSGISRLFGFNANREIASQASSAFQPSISKESPFLVYYGPLKNDGRYTTYLDRTNNADKWVGEKLTTDYQRYVTNKFKASYEPRSDIAKERELEKVNKSKEKSSDSTTQKRINESIKEYIKKNREGTGGGTLVKYIKYFQPDSSGNNVAINAVNEQGILKGDSTNAKELAEGYYSQKPKTKIKYIKDGSNTQLTRKNEKVSKEPYKLINNTFVDPITVSFAMGKDGAIRFRAFIKDILETVTPSYNPLQYIGRMEKFYNYTGVERKVGFKLGLLAASKDELDGMWRRINFLTGMAYPYGFNKGIFQPNIVRMTIGDVYRDQPGYIQSISTDFSGITDSWEVELEGKKVPISAMISVEFVLIEKASRVADSPFYGINENNPGFSQQISTAARQAESRNNAPATSAGTTVPNSTRVESRNGVATIRNAAGAIISRF